MPVNLSEMDSVSLLRLALREARTVGREEAFRNRLSYGEYLHLGELQVELEKRLTKPKQE